MNINGQRVNVTAHALKRWRERIGRPGLREALERSVCARALAVYLRVKDGATPRYDPETGAVFVCKDGCTRHSREPRLTVLSVIAPPPGEAMLLRRTFG